jgi:predicted nucleic acid-binding Zn finger protein
MVVDFSSIKQLNCNLQFKMCRPCTHIIIIQIMKDSANLHFITIYKHEMDLKLHALTFKVERRLQVDILKCYF